MSDAGVELLERGEELRRLGVLLQDARFGRGGMVVVAGEAGIGKSALLDAARVDAVASGLQVLSARGSDLERGFAYGVIRQALERATAGRAELFAGRAALAVSALAPLELSVGDRAVTEGVLYGLYWLLDAIVAERPALLMVDDAQWADEQSVAFLRFLALRLDGLPLAVVLAARLMTADDQLAALVADPAVEVLRPVALGLEGTMELIAREFGRAPEAAFAMACRDATGGNPFLIEHLARALRAEGIAPESGHVGRVAGLRADSLTGMVLARVDAPARALARAVAILGEEVAVGLAAQAASLPEADAEAAAERLAAAGVLADARPLLFRHALLRSAVLAGMSAGERTRAHAAGVDLLRQRDAPAERVAAHVMLLDPGTVPDAIRTLQMAARDASARGAHGAAVALLRRALEEPLEDQQRVSVLMALGAAETELAQPSAADRFIEAASLFSDPDARFEAALAACAAATLDAARGRRAIALLDSGQPIPGDRESQIRAMNARLNASFSDPVRQHELAAAAEALSPLPGETDAERRLLAWLARLRLERGENAERVAEVAEPAVGDLFDETHWTIGILIALTQTDRLALAGQLADRAIQRAQERGSPQLYVSAMSWHGRIARITGDLPVAEGFARAAIDAAEGALGSWRHMAASILIATLIDQGRIDEADAVWAAMGLSEVLPPQRPLTVLLQIRARLRAAQGNPDRALADFREARQRLGPSSQTINGVNLSARIAETLHALGRDDEARAESSAMLAVARRFGAASALGAALRVHGLLTDDPAVLREAVDVLRSSPARLEEARAHTDLGAHLRRHGARRDAREELRAGHELAITCGAHALAQRARAELAASGIRLVTRDPQRRDELTPSEHRIARMAANGATNRDIAQALFLTVKTVEMHLSNAYRKLDIRSRRDLHTALAAHAQDQAN